MITGVHTMFCSPKAADEMAGFSRRASIYMLINVIYSFIRRQKYVCFNTAHNYPKNWNSLRTEINGETR
jgi:hypothetical protein